MNIHVASSVFKKHKREAREFLVSHPHYNNLFYAIAENEEEAKDSVFSDVTSDHQTQENKEARQEIEIVHEITRMRIKG